MQCFHGVVQSVGNWDRHFEGHRVGAVVKVMNPKLFNSLAVMSISVSELANFNLDEAFAEGYIKGDPLFIRSVSSYVETDPVDAGAPDLVAITQTRRR